MESRRFNSKLKKKNWIQFSTLFFLFCPPPYFVVAKLFLYLFLMFTIKNGFGQTIFFYFFPNIANILPQGTNGLSLVCCSLDGWIYRSLWVMLITRSGHLFPYIEHYATHGTITNTWYEYSSILMILYLYQTWIWIFHPWYKCRIKPRTRSIGALSGIGRSLSKQEKWMKLKCTRICYSS